MTDTKGFKIEVKWRDGEWWAYVTDLDTKTTNTFHSAGMAEVTDQACAPIAVWDYDWEERPGKLVGVWPSSKSRKLSKSNIG